jgi:hypothetical protein
MHTYFSICGRQTELALQELNLVQSHDLKVTKNNIAIFQTQSPEKLSLL